MKNKQTLIWSACILAASLTFFGAIFILDIETDIQAHLELLQKTIRGEMPIAVNANFMFYLAAYIIALCQNNQFFLSVSASIVLALAVTARFLLTRYYLEKHMQRILTVRINSGKLLWFASLAMLLTFSLPTFNLFLQNNYYLGQIPMNVWHNSTTILLMPFAMLLFFRSFEQLEKPTQRGILIITGMVALNLAAKPSFFFVFCMVYPLMLLWQFGLSRQFWQNMIPVMIGLGLLAAQYYAIYQIGYRAGYTDEREVVINFLAVWHIFSPNIPLSLLASLVFPLTYLVSYPGDLAKNRLVQYSCLAYLASLVIFSILAETETHLGHGNFFWQTVVCSYLLFVVLLMQFIPKLLLAGLSGWKNRLILMAFALHAASGIIYLIRFLIFKTYD